MRNILGRRVAGSKGLRKHGMYQKTSRSDLLEQKKD